MLSFFRKTRKVDKLYKKYRKLIKESRRLASSSRIESDLKYAEAQAVLDEVYSLSKN